MAIGSMVTTEAASDRQIALPELPSGRSVDGWLDDLFPGESGDTDLPVQQTGSAENQPYTVSTAETTAPGGVGNGQGTAPGELAAYTPPELELEPGLSAAGATGFDPATSEVDQAKSSERMTYYRNSDGSVTREYSEAPVNYRTSSGAWRPIDTRLERETDGRWHQAAGALDVSFAATSADPAVVTLRVDAEHSVSYSLQGAGSVDAQVSGSEVLYPAVLPDTDLHVTATPTGMKESLILHSSDAASRWVFPLALRGLTAREADDGSIELLDDRGEIVHRIPAGFAFDSEIDRRTGTAETTYGVDYTITTVGGAPALQVSLDKQWLNDANRVFPVTVDPSITEMATSTYSQASGDMIIDHSAEPSIYVGSRGDATTAATSYLTFPTDLDNSGVLVNAATLRLFNSYAASCTAKRFDVAAVNKAWTLSSASYYPGRPTYGASIGSATPYVPTACANTTGKTMVGDWVDVPLAPAAIQAWASGTSPNYGLAIYAATTDALHWKAFGSSNLPGYGPRLLVTTTGNVPPQVDTMYPANGRVTNSLTPSLIVTGHDIDKLPSPNLQYLFQIWTATGAAVAQSGLTSSATWSVPAGKLQFGQSYSWTVQAYDGQYYSSAPPQSQFSVQVPQPVVTSSLSQNSGAQGTDPSLGNYTTSATDAEVPTAGPALSVVRSYNSRDPRSTGAFGAGWSSVVDARATEAYDAAGAVQSVVVTYPEGAEVGYGRNADGSFTPPQGRFATLTRTAGGYSLTDKNGTIYTFAENLGAGAYGVSAIADANRRALTFAYTSGRVSLVTSAVSGRSLAYTWSTPSGSTVAHVTSVRTDAADAERPDTALTWTYTYSGDQLSAACPPGTATACSRYEYSAVSQYRNQILNRNPQSFWPLTETSGSFVNSAVLVNQGSDRGSYSSVTLGQPGPLAGQPTGAATFDGVRSHITFGKYPTLDASAQSLSMWFKTTTPTGVLFSYSAEAIQSGSSTSFYNPALYVGSDGHLLGEFWQGAATPMKSPGPVTDGAWHHVVLAGAGNAQSMYLDGQKVGTLAGAVSVPGKPEYYVGAGFLGGNWPSQTVSTAGTAGQVRYFKGSIAAVSLSDSALSPTDVAALYSAGKQAGSLLTRITRPSGKTYAAITYDPGSGLVSQLTDENGGVWKYAAPTMSGSGQVYRSAVLGSGPKVYYRLSDAAGAAQPYNEVTGGAATYANVGLGYGGPFQDSRAANFNGTSSGVTLPSKLTATSTLTTELWFRTSAATPQMLFSTGNTALGVANPSPSSMPVLYVGNDGKLYGHYSNGTVAGMASVGKVNDGVWHHVALTGGGDTQALYLDGKKIGTQAGTISSSDPTSFVGAGVFTGAGWPAAPAGNVWNYFNGQISDVAVFSSALSEEEVAHHYMAYRSSKGGPYPVMTVSGIDPGGYAISSQYDPLNGNRPISQTDARGQKTSFGYDVGGFLRTQTDPNGNVVTTGHDVRGNAVSQTTCQNLATNACSTAYYTYYPDSTSTRLSPDPRNDLVLTMQDARSSSSADNRYRTSYSYDAAGNRVGVTTPPVEGFPAGRTTLAEYSDGSTAVDGGVVPAGLPVRTVTPGGVVNIISYTRAGDVASTTDGNGLVTRFSYDGLGRLSAKTVVSDTYPDGLTTTYEYDGRNQVVRQVDPPVTDRITGAVHTAVTSTVFDADGNLTRQTVEDSTGGDAPRAVTATFTAVNKVASETDAGGNTTAYTYDQYGNKRSQTTPDGTKTEWTYNANGQMLTQSVWTTGSPLDPKPATLLTEESRGYDAGGRLARITDAMGNITSYAYFGNGLTGFVLRNDAAKVKGFYLEQDWYDAAGNMVKKATNNGATVTTFSVDAADRVTKTVQDPTGRARTTAVSYTPDDHAATTVETDAQGFSRTTTSTYDAVGNPLLQTRFDGSGSPPITVTRTLDRRGLPTSMTDPHGSVTHLDYDEAGQPAVTTAPTVSVENGGEPPLSVRPVTSTGYNTFGEAVERQDPNGNVTTTVYDARGRAVSVTQPNYVPPGESEPIRAVTVRAYDAMGHLASETDPLGKTTSYVYDDRGGLVKVTDPDGGATTTTYDANGERLSVTDATGARTEATYDYLGRQLTSSVVERYPSAVTSTTTNSYAASAANPAGAFLASTTTQTGSATSFGYDALGEQISTTDSAGNTTRYAYDFVGNRTLTTYADGTSAAVTYGLTGQPASIQQRNPEGQALTTTTATYDAVGNQTSTTDGRGNTTTFGYDATGMLLEQVEPVSDTSSIRTTFGYDAAGNRTRFTDGRGNTWISTFNSWNLPESVIQPATDSYQDVVEGTFTTSYDAAGRPVRQTQPGGVTLTAAYDAQGRLTAQSGSGAEAETASRTFEYDAVGRLVSASTSAVLSPGSQSLPATNETFTYNDRGALLSATGAGGDSAFGYDRDGRMTSRVDAAGTTSYGYDTAGRLASVTDAATAVESTLTFDVMSQVTGIRFGAGGNVRSFGYDALHRLTEDTLRDAGGATVASIAYGYDLNGNLSSKATTGFGSSVQNTYAYDKADRLVSWSDGTDTTPYAYDASGNRTQVGAEVYTYDARDQLTSDGVTSYRYTANGTMFAQDRDDTSVPMASDAFGQMVSHGTQTYVYDALARSVLATGGSGNATFSYSGTANTPASDGSNTYSRDPAGGLLGVGAAAASGGTVPGSGVFAYVDQHTDVVGAFTAAGSALTGSTAYDPLGNVVTTDGVVGRLGYQSGWTDEATGTVNMAARWYNPGTGQFMNRDTVSNDPVPNSAEANPFAYVDGNPMLGTDPSGHGLFDVVKKAAGWVNKKVVQPVVRKVVQPAVKAVVQKVVQPIVRTVATVAHKVADALVTAARPVVQTVQHVATAVQKKAQAAVHVVQTAYHATTQAVTHAVTATANAVVRAATATAQVVEQVASAAATFVQHHSSAIAGFAVGAIAFGGCMAVTAGVGVIGCAALAGAAGNAVSYAMDCGKSDQGCTAGGVVEAVGLGAVGGALGGAVGGVVAGAVAGRLGGSVLNGVLPQVARVGLSGAAGGAAGGGAAGAAGYAGTCGSTKAGCSLSGAAGATVSTAAQGAVLGAVGGVAGGSLGRAGSSDRSRLGGTNPRADGEVRPPTVCHSFTGETPVRMADGSSKRIDEVRVGDRVANSVPGSAKTEAHTVERVIVTPDDRDFVDVSIRADSVARTSDVLVRAGRTLGAVVAAGALIAATAAPAVAAEQSAGADATLTTTYYHPVYDVTKAAFVEARDLEPGDQVQTIDGTATITGVRPYHQEAVTYDLTIDGLHTYFVQAGDTTVLVHNCSPSQAGSGTGAGPADAPIRAVGAWTRGDIGRGAYGKPPAHLGDRLEIHHADQMPGSAIHELNQSTHRGAGTDLHRNTRNQGVTPEMRRQDTQLHWWYRSQEQGWGVYGPSLWFDNWG